MSATGAAWRLGEAVGGGAGGQRDRKSARCGVHPVDYFITYSDCFGISGNLEGQVTPRHTSRAAKL